MMGRSLGEGGGSGGVRALRLPLDASSASDAHLISSIRDKVKQQKQDPYFFANKNTRFVSGSQRWCCKKIKNKTGQTLGFMAFSGNEGMGSQRSSNTQQTRNSLYF